MIIMITDIWGLIITITPNSLCDRYSHRDLAYNNCVEEARHVVIMTTH
jgi:hypothetical protein